jgi:hypothetical protein
MRKIFAFLCALLLAVQFSAAQRTLFVIDKDGELAAYSAASVSFSNFSFTIGDVTEVTEESFCASFQVAFKSNEIKSFAQTLEVGVCFSDIHTSPTIQDEKRSLATSLGSYSFILSSLFSGTTYYWRPYVKVGNAVCYGEISEKTTLGKKPEGNNKSINGHKFIDLGLPSGLLWAETNIGAAIAADDGNFYAWGETTTKSDYSEDAYKYYNSATSTYTKYNSNKGKNVLANEDDVAYVNWGSFCRMPTNAEFEELLNLDNCTWTWTSMKNSSSNSVSGYKVTSNKNGNSIFLPASGYCYGDDFYSHGSDGNYYWSSTLCTEDIDFAYSLGFFSSNCFTSGNIRCCGLTVRPVAEQNKEGQTTQPTVSTPYNMWVVNSSGKANGVEVSSVDFATFHADDSWFSITDDGHAQTNNSISVYCTVATGGVVKSLAVTPEVGVCYSKDNSLPTINDNRQTLGSSLKIYSFTISSLISGTTYYYRVYIKLNDEVFYGDVVEVNTLGTKPVDNSKSINGHKFVDLWLPSGLLWAETNIGAETAADDGNYYAWGETTTKSNYSWSTYKYGTSSSDITKYNSTYGKKVLDLEDDAAYVNWGSSCRMPTTAECEELFNTNNCTWTWTTMKNSSGSSVHGYKVTSKNNGNSIFLPASGERHEDGLYDHGSLGHYWSCALSTSSVDCAYYLYFISSYHNVLNYYRYYGRTVRPVAEP